MFVPLPLPFFLFFFLPSKPKHTNRDRLSLSFLRAAAKEPRERLTQQQGGLQIQRRGGCSVALRAVSLSAAGKKERRKKNPSETRPIMRSIMRAEGARRAPDCKQQNRWAHLSFGLEGNKFFRGWAGGGVHFSNPNEPINLSPLPGPLPPTTSPPASGG